MAKIRVMFDVQLGKTDCNKCPFYHTDYCPERFFEMDCEKYDLSTLVAESLTREE